jgi:hypothetical protein
MPVYALLVAKMGNQLREAMKPRDMGEQQFGLRLIRRKGWWR